MISLQLATLNMAGGGGQTNSRNTPITHPGLEGDALNPLRLSIAVHTSTPRTLPSFVGGRASPARPCVGEGFPAWNGGDLRSRGGLETAPTRGAIRPHSTMQGPRHDRASRNYSTTSVSTINRAAGRLPGVILQLSDETEERIVFASGDLTSQIVCDSLRL